MKSTLWNMVAVLFTITLIASTGVGVVNRITEEPIAEARAAAVVEALNRVLPPFEATATDSLTIDDLPITVYTASRAEGGVVGYAVETATKNGFGGLVRMMVGFTPDGEVVNVNVLEQTETPGLGTKMADEGNPLLQSIRGKRLETMQLVDGRLAVRKDGGDVDALTAATISSRAYCDAVNRAWMAYKSITTGTDPADAASGATRTESASETAETSGLSQTSEKVDAPEKPAMQGTDETSGTSEMKEKDETIRMQGKSGAASAAETVGVSDEKNAEQGASRQTEGPAARKGDGDE